MQLVTPCLELIPSYIDALREGSFNPMQLGFGRVSAGDIEKDPKAYIETLNRAAPFDVNLPVGTFRVLSHEILWIAQEGRFLGTVALRYKAEPATLSDYAGHIGMAMRPFLVNRGIGVRTIQQSLSVIAEKFIQRGFSSVLATCNAQNRSSRRLIEHFGGQLERESPDMFGDGTALLFRLSLDNVRMGS